MESSSIQIVDTKSLGVKEKVSAYFELTKPRIAFMLVLTSGAGFYMGSSGDFDVAKFINAMIGITLLAFGVATLNQWMERDLDLLMPRTEKRPLPTGRITSTEALIFGVIQCLVAEVYLFYLVNPLTALLGITVIVGYVLLYTPMKTRTSASTAVGAIPGAMPPLMGWTAASDSITLGALSLFIILFLWQFPHFFAIAWMYREDYAKAGIIMLPVIDTDGWITARQIILFSSLLFVVSLAPFFLGIAGIYYIIGTAILGVWFLVESIRTALDKGKKSSRRLLLVSVLYLPLIFGLLVIDKL